MAVLYTIGYEKAPTTADLILRLAEAGVERLVDVRELPQSRRRGFSKRALCDALADVGIVYEHCRPLGNPRPSRDLYKSGQIEAGREGYRAHVQNGASVFVDILADSLDERPTAVMCLEHEPGECHRRVLAEEIQVRRPDVQVIDL